MVAPRASNDSDALAEAGESVALIVVVGSRGEATPVVTWGETSIVASESDCASPAMPHYDSGTEPMLGQRRGDSANACEAVVPGSTGPGVLVFTRRTIAAVARLRFSRR